MTLTPDDIPTLQDLVRKFILLEYGIRNPPPWLMCAIAGRPYVLAWWRSE
jgi:hypothetical protein